MNTNPLTKNFFNSIGNPDDISGDGTEVLKIAVDLRYIRYFIENRLTSTIVFYGDYALQSVSGLADLAEQLANILSKDAFLSKSFLAVKVCWFTDFEIIPSVFFDEGEMAADTVANEILGGEANFIFESPAVLTGILRDKFPAFQNYHSGAAMIEVIRRIGMASPDQLFINVHAENIEIACFGDGGALLLYNRYEYKACQDYIYFVLLVADEMKLDRQEAKAVLMGEINRDSQLYEMTHRYFRHVGFMSQPEHLHFSRAFDVYPKYFNYPLYNL